MQIKLNDAPMPKTKIHSKIKRKMQKGTQKNLPDNPGAPRQHIPLPHFIKHLAGTLNPPNPIPNDQHIAYMHITMATDSKLQTSFVNSVNRCRTRRRPENDGRHIAVGWDPGGRMRW